MRISTPNRNIEGERIAASPLRRSTRRNETSPEQGGAIHLESVESARNRSRPRGSVLTSWVPYGAGGCGLHDRSAQTKQAFLRWRHGEPGALEQILPFVYDELRRLAAANLRH